MTPAQRRVVFFFIRGHWKAYALLASLSLAMAAMEALHLAMLYPVLNSLLRLPASGRLGRLGVLIERLAAALPFEDALTAGCVLLILLTPAKGAMAVLYEFLNGWVSGEVLYRTKKRIMEKYAGAPYSFFLDNKLGDLMHWALTSPTRLSLVLSRVPLMLVEALRIAAILALLASIHPGATLALVALGLLANALTSLVARKISYNLGRGRIESGAAQTSLFNEWVAGMKHISVYGVKAWWLGRFDGASRRYNELYVKDTALLAMPKNLIETLVVTGLFGALLVVRRSAPESLFASLPLAGTFCMALLKMLPSLAVFSRCRMEFMGSLPDVEGIHESLHQDFKRRPRGARRFEGLREAVRFEGVRFAYPGRGAVLSGLDLTVRSRRTTAIVGGSGSGKTTVVNLLLGLYDPDAGRILVDGTDLAGLDPDSWLGRLAVVSQDPFIFHGTVADNILFGRPGFSRADVEEAARVAHCRDFVSAMPEGFSTLVGERGMKLSGGQQQRIAVARAVLGGPEILVFDEATSALDSVSEAAVQEAIAEVSRDKTVLQIAHRLSTIRAADSIVVLHGGSAAEEGTHEELLARQGHYARLYTQAQPEAKGQP